MAEWIAIGITLVFGIASSAFLWGQMNAKQTATDEKLELHAKYHADHYKHQNDEDAHWTKRERDELTKKIDAIHTAVLKPKTDG